jgi:hypothetical protein
VACALRLEVVVVVAVAAPPAPTPTLCCHLLPGEVPSLRCVLVCGQWWWRSWSTPGSAACCASRGRVERAGVLATADLWDALSSFVEGGVVPRVGVGGPDSPL